MQANATWTLDHGATVRVTVFGPDKNGWIYAQIPYAPVPVLIQSHQVERDRLEDKSSESV